MDIRDLMNKKINDLHKTVMYTGPNESTIGAYEQILRMCEISEIDLPFSPEETSGLQNHYIHRFHEKEGNAKKMYNLLDDLLLSSTDMACSRAFYGIKLPGADPEKIAKKIKKICERREAKPSGEAIAQWKNFAIRYDKPEAYDLLLRVCDRLGLEVWLGKKEQERIFEHYRAIGDESGTQILRKMEEARKRRISSLRFDLGNLREISDLLEIELNLNHEGAKEVARELLEAGNFEAARQLSREARLRLSEIFRELHPLHECQVSKETFLEEDVTDETLPFVPDRYCQI